MCGSTRHDNKLLSTLLYRSCPPRQAIPSFTSDAGGGVELHDRGRGCKIRPDLKPKGGTRELPRETIDTKKPWQEQGNDQPWQQDL